MKVWSLIFVAPALLQSARVAAPDPATAAAVVSAEAGMAVDLRRGDLVRFHHCGEWPVGKPLVLRCVSGPLAECGPGVVFDLGNGGRGEACQP